MRRRTGVAAGTRSHYVGSVVHPHIADLDARYQGVLDAAGIEPCGQVGLVDPALGVGVAALGRARNQAIGHVATRIIRVGDDVVQGGAGDTRSVRDGQVLVQVVLQTDRAGVRGALAEVATFQAIEVVPIDLGGLAARIARRRHRQRNAVIRHVVGFQVVVRQRRAGRRIEAEGDGRRHAPATDVNAIAPGDVGFVLHQVQAPGDVVAEHAVDVQRVAARLVRAEGDAGVAEVALLGGLADQIEAATRGARASVGRPRPLAHLDALDVEDLTGLRADITQAIDKGVALGVEAANDRPVTRRVAALTRTEGNAGGGTQRVDQRERAGVADHLIGDHGDRFWGLAQRRGVLLRSGGIGFVALLLLADHGQFVERDRRIAAGGSGVRHGLGNGGGGESGKGNTDSRSQHAGWLGQFERLTRHGMQILRS